MASDLTSEQVDELSCVMISIGAMLPAKGLREIAEWAIEHSKLRPDPNAPERGLTQELTTRKPNDAAHARLRAAAQAVVDEYNGSWKRGEPPHPAPWDRLIDALAAELEGGSGPDEIQERIGGTAKFRELGAIYGYGNGIDVLARAWAERSPHMNTKSVGQWLIHLGQGMVDEAELEGGGE